MKQPELGKKLAELRKEKKLTQEELVEACQVSVRTIQRIESGEVTPRNSTIKIILAALDEDFTYFHRSHDSETNNLLHFENSLQVAWISGIVYFIVGLLESGLDYTVYEKGDQDVSSILYLTTKIAVLVSYFFFIWGFIKLAEYFNNHLLKIGSYLMIGVTAMIVSLDVYFLLFQTIDETYNIVYLPVVSISAGAIGLIWGWGLLRLQDGMGRLALLAGLFELLIGFCFLVVLLFFIGFILWIPAIIIEITILYKGYEFIKTERLKPL